MDKQTLKMMSDSDLIVMQNQLRRYPEDKQELQDVLEELGRRSKSRQ